MPRLKRKLELERVMGRQAWTAQELAPKFGMSVLSMRRYLRIYYEARRLDRKKFGVLLYYVIARFLEPPDKKSTCPMCVGVLDVYFCKCGCTFSICTENYAHSTFSYCEKHKGGESSHE